MTGVNRSFFFRLILTNLSVITIILLIILSLQNFLFLGKYKSNLIQSHYQSLIYTQEHIDKEIINLQQLSDGISISRDISYFNLVENPHEAYLAVKKLKSYFLANSFFDRMILIFNNDDYLYTSDGSYIKENFYIFKQMKDNPNIQNELISLINGQTHSKILKTDNSILFCFLYPTFALTSRGMLIYDVTIEHFRNFLPGNSFENGQNTIVFDQNNNFLISYIPIDKNEIRIISEELRNGSIINGTGEVSIDDEEFLIQIRKSDLTGLVYISTKSMKTALMPYYNSRLSIIYSFLFLYIISIFLSYAAAKNNYYPFRKIKDMLLKDSNDNGINIKNEMQWMEDVIFSMKKMIDEKKLAFKNNSINKLVQNKYSDLNIFVIEMNQSGYYPPYELFGFIIIQFEDLSYKKLILNILDSNEYESLILIQKDNMKSLQVFYLYNTSLSEDSLKKSLTELFHTLIDESPGNMTMSVGRPGNNISSVTSSLTESITALEYRFVIGRNNIIFFNDIRELNNFERPISASELDLINIAIHSGNVNEIAEILKKIINNHNIHNLSLINAKALTYQIANRVMRTIDEILVRKNLPLSLSSEIQQKIYLSSIDETVESIITILRELEYVLFADGLRKNSRILNNALEIIKSSFTDPELSVQKIADTLNVSQSYLSRIYKKENSDTILSYITTKRIGLAKKLLIESDLPIKLITIEVGYLDLSSFTRKFKQQTGITPGNYRKRYS